MSDAEFVLESAVHGFHVYRADWTPVAGERLTAEREPDNQEDAFAVKLTNALLATCLRNYRDFAGCFFGLY